MLGDRSNRGILHNLLVVTVARCRTWIVAVQPADGSAGPLRNVQPASPSLNNIKLSGGRGLCSP